VRPRPRPDPVGPGQESVWDYPRPPAVESTDEHVEVHFAGRVIADSRRAVRVLETSHPPSYYLPLEDVDPEVLVPNPHRTFCEFKGAGRLLRPRRRRAALGDGRLDGIPIRPRPTPSWRTG
jgi:uncharacterized protein (DUF427 family)